MCCFWTSGERVVGVGFGRAIGQEIDKTHEIMGRFVLLECARRITFASSFRCHFVYFLVLGRKERSLHLCCPSICLR